MIPNGSPYLKSIVTNDGLFGAFSGELVLWNINSGAEFLGFSKTLPSVEVWKRLSSTEKGGAPFLSLGIVILCFFAYLIKSVLEFNFQILHGAIVFIFGPKKW